MTLMDMRKQRKQIRRMSRELGIPYGKQEYQWMRTQRSYKTHVLN